MTKILDKGNGGYCNGLYTTLWYYYFVALFGMLIYATLWYYVKHTTVLKNLIISISYSVLSMPQHELILPQLNYTKLQKPNDYRYLA